MPGFVQLLREWTHFLLRKFAHAALQQLLFFGQFEVHGAAPAIVEVNKSRTLWP
jgi:hypothetical protein